MHFSFEYIFSDNDNLLQNIFSWLYFCSWVIGTFLLFSMAIFGAVIIRTPSADKLDRTVSALQPSGKVYFLAKNLKKIWHCHFKIYSHNNFFSIAKLKVQKNTSFWFFLKSRGGQKSSGRSVWKSSDKVSSELDHKRPKHEQKTDRVNECWINEYQKLSVTVKR